MGCTADEDDRLRVEPTETLQRGDILAFRVPSRAMACGGMPGDVYIKRVIGLPGEMWQEKDGYVYIDDRRLSEPYVEAQRRDSDSMPARRVPASTYFVLGDNRMQSCDSRFWGVVPAKNVVGRVVQILREDETIDLE